MSKLALRIKTKSGQQILSDLVSTDNINDLKTRLTEITGIKSENLHILTGFPPKVLELSNSKLSLQEAGISSGETLIIEERLMTENESNKEKNNQTESRSHISETESLNMPGIFMKKVVPADNSCLFTSVGYVISGKVNSSCSNFMREIIANSVAADPEEYSEAFLNKPNKEYCEWILKSDSWGGAIELSILSKFYGLEIVVVNSVNGNVNRFGEDQHYSQRVFLLFDGIHYDPLYMEPLDGGPFQTVFPIDDNKILLQAVQLAKEAKSSHQYTDVQKFTLKCMECHIHFNGPSAASEHAKGSGHMNFGEVKS